MSLLTYNSVTIPYVYTTRFHQRPVYDDMGNVDWMTTRFDIAVQGVVNYNYLRLMNSDAVGIIDQNPAAVMKAVREKLLTPRKTLSFKFNNYELIPQVQRGTNGSCDAVNGPQPQDCQILQLTNETFLILYRITAQYREKTQINDNGTITNERGSDVLTNRWSETVEIDGANFTKAKVREGKFVIRSDNAANKTPDQFRSNFAVVSVPQGFLRRQSRYTVSPDGLALQYRVVDEEVYKMPPNPAFEAKGNYVETSTKNGAWRVGEAKISLKGSKDTPQFELIRTAVALCAKKLEINGALGKGKDGADGQAGDVSNGFGMLMACVADIDMFDNVVHITMTSVMGARNLGNNSGRLNGVAHLTSMKLMTKVPLVDPMPGLDEIAGTPNYKVRGTASILLQAAAYFDPNLSTSRNNLGRKLMTSTKDNASVDVANAGGVGAEVQTGGPRGTLPGQANPGDL